jgi:hypothetical protein
MHNHNDQHHLTTLPTSFLPVHPVECGVEERFNGTAGADDVPSQATRHTACEQMLPIEPTIRQQLQDIRCNHTGQQ